MTALELASPTDAHVDFCLWDYAPPVSPEGRLRAVNILMDSFRVQDLEQHGSEVVEALRSSLGPMRTVWGIKQANGRIGWECYFYDYARRHRTRSITRVLDILKPHVASEPGVCARVNENCDYFMFSLDFDGSTLRGQQPLNEIQVYMGNPGSTVSSGICYALRADGMHMKNFYFFFDARTQMRDIVDKIESSVFLDMSCLAIDDILWPALRKCRTIVVANKPTHDGVYFSRISVDQLLVFLERMDYPEAHIAFIRQHKEGFEHLLFDVGIDYRMQEGKLNILKSAYYGVF